MSRFRADDAAAAYDELVRSGDHWESLLQAARDDVRQWRYTNLPPDPISPDGVAAAVDCELWMTDEFVRPATVWKNAATSRCYWKVGFDDQQRQRLLECGSPSVWVYRDDSITEYDLSGDRARGRVNQRWLGPVTGNRPQQWRVSQESVVARYFDQLSDTQIRVVSESWVPIDGRFTHDTSLVVDHILTCDERGRLRKVETETTIAGEPTRRTVSWERARMVHGIMRGLQQRFRRND